VGNGPFYTRSMRSTTVRIWWPCLLEVMSEMTSASLRPLLDCWLS
jgi:hypothetical protein